MEIVGSHIDPQDVVRPSPNPFFSFVYVSQIACTCTCRCYLRKRKRTPGKIEKQTTRLYASVNWQENIN